jgi:Tfp pilus assembly protein PilN
MASAVKDKEAVAEKIGTADYLSENTEPKRYNFWLLVSAVVLALATASGAFLLLRRRFSSSSR